MAYVALGRTEQLKDIFIRGQVDPEGIHASEVALEETNRLQRIFDERVQTINVQKQNCWKISYLNVRSLKGKQLDVERDNFIMASDIFALGETWLEPCESVNFLGYEANFASHGKGKGVSTFSKMDSAQLNCVSSETFSAIHMRTEKFDLVFVYISSGCNKHEVFKLLEAWIENERPTAIIGDTNMDYLKECKIATFLETKGFEQQIKEATKDSGSLIDQVYANEAMRSLNIITEQCSAYYSDHDIVSIYIPK